jgi:hypothetical protein
MPRLDLLIRFLLSTAVGAGAALGIGAVVRPAITALPRVSVTAPPGSVPSGVVGPVAVTRPSAAPLNFAVQPAGSPPAPIPTLPPTSTIQLASATQATAPGVSAAPNAPNLPATPWWNPSVPRIAPITQFDGGPLQGFNCTLASGAMLARLAFGIVTTGSQLRALSGVPSGGTTLNDLATAIQAGWGVHFFGGAATPLQLRALLYGGAGATIQLNYGLIPISLRLQANFVGGHAIYVDGFHPADASGPAAYYVIDPIGRPWAGYRGDWWPADVVENAAVTFGHGRIYTSWAFPGGQVPANHPILPPSAYPSGNPVITPSPSATGSPGVTTSPGASASPSPGVSPPTLVDPMPPSSLPGGDDVPAGTPPPDVPTPPNVNIETGGLQVAPPPSLPCTTQPAEAGCPPGLLGVINVTGGATGSSPPLSPIHFLYANAIAPGTFQFVFDAPPSTQASVWLWPAGASGGGLHEATAEPAIVNGQSVWVATATLDPTADYSFVATATGAGTQAASSVGSLVVTR